MDSSNSIAITVLSDTRKSLNKLLILLIITFIIIMLAFIVVTNLPESSISEPFNLVAIIALIACLLAIIIIIIIRAKKKDEMTLEDDINYKLILNSNKPLGAIKSKDDIEYARNFIIDANLNRIEIDNKSAFKLINIISEIKIEQKETSIIESSPKELFDTIADIFR